MHWRSEAGRVCFTRLLEETKADQVRRETLSMETIYQITQDFAAGLDSDLEQNFDLDFTWLGNSGVLEHFDFDSVSNMTDTNSFNIDESLDFTANLQS